MNMNGANGFTYRFFFFMFTQIPAKIIQFDFCDIFEPKGFGETPPFCEFPNLFCQSWDVCP